MARVAKTASVKEAKRRGREPMTFEDYLAKPATSTQQRFADWLQGTVGYSPAGARTKADAFLDGVRLAVGMRILFQNSEESQKALAQSRAEKNGGAPTKKAKAEEAPVKKARAKKAAAEVETEVEETPKKKAKKTAKTAAEEAPVKRKPGRPPKVKAETAPVTEKPAKVKKAKKVKAEEPAVTKAKVKKVKVKTKREAPPLPTPDLSDETLEDQDVPF